MKRSFVLLTTLLSKPLVALHSDEPKTPTGEPTSLVDVLTIQRPAPTVATRL